MKAMMMTLAAGLFVFGAARPAAADPCFGLVCNDTKVERLFPNGNPAQVNVKTKDGGQQNLNCGPIADGGYLTLKTTNPLFSEIYAALLAATTHNKDVTIRIVAGTASCEIAYVVLENPAP